MNLKDKVVVVTGSSSGIGEATALAFAKEGAKVVVNSRVNTEGGIRVAEKIKKLDGEAIYIQADVSDSKEVDRLFNEVVKKYKTVDVLINNAASPAEKVPFFDANEEDLLELFKLNVISAMLCSKEAIKIMKKGGGGKILNTSSIKGWEHGGGSVTYAVTKAAINSFTRTLAKQVAPSIHVNAVAPGYVKTRIYDTVSEDKIKALLEGTFLKRWVTVEEVSNAFLFLAKNDAMTGQIIYVDAGFTLK